MMEHRGVKAIIREGTSDDWVVREVLDGEYSDLRIRESDVVADIGANIGMFAIWALRKGAAKVYGYEADPENYELALKNLELNGLQAEMHCQAVVGNGDEIRRLYRHPEKTGRVRTGANSLIRIPDAQTVGVRCVNINKIIRDVRPSVVKMDIEGAEYECITAADGFPGVREMILEFHHGMLNDKSGSKFIEVIDILKKEFGNVHSAPQQRLSLIYCRR